MAVRLWAAPRPWLIVVGKRWPPTTSRVLPTLACATGRSGYRAMKDWDSDNRRSISQLNRQDPRIIILTIRVNGHPFSPFRRVLRSTQCVACACMLAGGLSVAARTIESVRTVFSGFRASAGSPSSSARRVRISLCTADMADTSSVAIRSKASFWSATVASAAARWSAVRRRGY